MARFIKRFFRPYVYLVALSIPFTIVVSSTGGIMAYLMKPIMDEGFIGKDLIALALNSAALVGIYLLRGISRVLAIYFMNFANQSVIKDVRAETFEKIHKLSLDWFTREKSGAMISKVISDVELIGGLARIIITLLRSPITVIVLIFVAAKMSVHLTALAVLMLPLGIIPLKVLTGKIRMFSTSSRISLDSVAERVRESMQGAKEVRIFPVHGIMSRRFRESISKYKKDMVRRAVFTELAPSITELLGAIMFGALLILGGYQVSKGVITPGSFLAFIAAMIGLWEPVKGFSQALSNLQHILPSISRIMQVVEAKPSVVERENALSKISFEGSIEFENVCFCYNSEHVLKGINLKVNKGEKIAIVGASGVGKTTFISLVPRFYDVTSGSIKMDGIDIRDLRISDLRNLISIVDQEPFIFDDTIYNNILFGRPTASPEEVENAAKIAGIHNFIISLPEDYRTVVGERGITLSVGQRHRIAIARAVLKNTPILILDEPTASLDPETEERIWEALMRIIPGKTVIVVSHKPSTVRWTDKVFVMASGTIVEEGTHDELMEKEGKYYELFKNAA